MLTSVLLIFAVAVAAAQNNTDTIPNYKKHPTIPLFSMTKVPDSTKFTKDDIKGGKYTIVMIFSPDCEHCQHETRELLAHIDLFKDAQFVMASPLNYSNILRFYYDYGLAEHSNFIVCRDDSYMLGLFYHVHNYPSLYVYDKDGYFVKAFEGGYPVEQVAAALH